MRSNVTSSLAVWATLALTAAAFPACAKSIVGDTGGAGDDAGVTSGNDASTVAAGDDAGSGDPSQGGGSTPSDDAGSGTSTPAPDAGSPSGANDSGSGAPPTSDDAGSSPVVDSAPPTSPANCADTTEYQSEYEFLEGLGLGTSCTTNADCSSSNCCYDGTAAQGLGGLCVTQ